MISTTYSRFSPRAGSALLSLHDPLYCAGLTYNMDKPCDVTNVSVQLFAHVFIVPRQATSCQPGELLALSQSWSQSRPRSLEPSFFSTQVVRKRSAKKNGCIFCAVHNQQSPERDCRVTIRHRVRAFAVWA